MRHTMRSTTIAALTLALALTAPARAAKPSAFEGRWDVVMERKGMKPATAKGLLVLGRDGKVWTGTMTFQVLMNGQALPVIDVQTKGSKISFGLRASDQKVAFSGAVKKGSFAGRCTWNGRTYPWTATSAAAARPVERFEDGLKFDRDWKRGDAEKLGLRGEALDELIRRAGDAGTDALIVLKDGKVVCERTFGGPQTPVFTMSVTKVVTAMAVARLLETGKIDSLDAPVSTWFPQWGEGRKGRVTLRHLLNHTSGIAHGKTALELNRATDKVAYVLGLDVVAEPGSVHGYNNEAVALLTGVIAKAAGKPTGDFVDQWLFGPLGIEDWWWKHDETGSVHTYADLKLRPRDLARIGQLMVDGGRAGKRQVLKPESVALLGAPATDLVDDQGLIWRLIRDTRADGVIGYQHTGSLGQNLVVIPGEKLVGVRMRRFRGDGVQQPPGYDFGAFRTLLLATLGR